VAWKWWESLTASMGLRRGIGGDGGPGRLDNTSARDWQTEAVAMYDIVPELRYGISWIASSASRAALICARVPDHPGAQPVPIDEKSRAYLPLRDLAATAPEQAHFIERAVTLLKLVGQWFLVGFDDEHRRRHWLLLSAREVTTSGDYVEFTHPSTGQKIKRRRLGSTPPQGQQEDVAWVIPMWYPHPIKASEPDAPTRALIPTLQELVDLSAHVQTAARSRLAGAGILLLPSSLTPIAPGQSTGVNPPKGHSAMRALVRTAQAAIRNPFDIGRHLPVMFQGNPEALDAVRHLTLDTPFDERVDSLRTSAVRRIAIGLDIPPEVLTGMGDLNHWTAWQVDSAGQKVNVAPALTFLCHELTRLYYQPALRAMGVENPEKYMLWYDDSALESTPNKAEVAMRAYELGLVTEDAARETIGYGPADAPPAGYIPPVVRMRRANAQPTDSTTNAPGIASTEETQTRLVSSVDDGWVACADVAARRALGRAGQFLLSSGGRTLRGKYRHVPLHDMHTMVSPANSDTASKALRDAFTELEVVEPSLVPAVERYTRDRLATRQPHDVAVLTDYINQGGGLPCP
jgi:hypothetical protein